jgi:PAS domain S-box-containing protein
MKDQEKTRDQLIGELRELRMQLAQVQRSETERERAEAAMYQSQRLLERTFASLRDAVFILDAASVQIIDCNPAASDVFGYNREEMIGRTSSFLHVDEAALEEFRRHLYIAMERHGLLHYLEFRMKRRNGAVLAPVSFCRLSIATIGSGTKTRNPPPSPRWIFSPLRGTWISDISGAVRLLANRKLDVASGGLPL